MQVGGRGVPKFGRSETQQLREDVGIAIITVALRGYRQIAD